MSTEQRLKEIEEKQMSDLEKMADELTRYREANSQLRAELADARRDLNECLEWLEEMEFIHKDADGQWLISASGERLLSANEKESR